MEPPAQAGTLAKHHTANKSPTNVTPPETKEKSKLDQPSPSTPDTDDLADDSTSNSSRLTRRSKKQTQCSTEARSDML